MSQSRCVLAIVAMSSAFQTVACLVRNIDDGKISQERLAAQIRTQVEQKLFAKFHIAADQVTRVTIGKPWKMSNADMADLAVWSGLEELDIGFADKLSDEGMAFLVRLPRLKKLKIGSDRITDDGLAHLARLNHLEDLVIVQARKISDAGLAHLRKVPLKRLSIEDTKVTGEGLRHLRADRLERLTLIGEKVDEHGVAQIARFKNLRRLALGGEKITDEALARLVDPGKLHSLSLNDVSASGAALDALEGRLQCLITVSYSSGTSIFEDEAENHSNP